MTPGRAPYALPEVLDACAVVAFPAVGGQVTPAVGSAAVGVGDAVGVGEPVA
jgi:hypothetical protein